MIENPFKNIANKLFKINLDGHLTQDSAIPIEETEKLIKRSEGPTSLQRIGVAAVVENLLGNTEEKLDFPGDRHRFSFAEATEITEKLKRMLKYTVTEEEVDSELIGKYTIKKMNLQPKSSDFAKEKLLALVNEIATNDLVGKPVWVAQELADLLAHGFYENEEKVYPPEDIEKFALVIYYLSYAVCFLEGNLPPNYLGYIADETVSLARKDEIAREENLHKAYALISQQPKILGENSKRIYNRIALRCEARRPKFMGKPVSYQEIAFFDETN